LERGENRLTPRSQQDRSRATRAALMTTARRLFAERGYAGVSADEIVSAAGLTRGALHHHFGDKKGLFRAVFEQLEAETNAELSDTAAKAPSGAAQMVAGIGTFLDICQRPEVLRIALTDAPAVLGWQTWREIGAGHSLGMIRAMIQQGITDGMIVAQPVDVLAQLVLGVTIEAALLIATAGNPELARRSVEPALITMLSGLVSR
jgi:AcrR family transcriptional regulator